MLRTWWRYLNGPLQFPSHTTFVLYFRILYYIWSIYLEIIAFVSFYGRNKQIKQVFKTPLVFFSYVLLISWLSRNLYSSMELVTLLFIFSTFITDFNGCKFYPEQLYWIIILFSVAMCIDMPSYQYFCNSWVTTSLGARSPPIFDAYELHVYSNSVW